MELTKEQFRELVTKAATEAAESAYIEGFDAHFSNNGDQTIRLTWGEFKALKKLIKELDK